MSLFDQLTTFLGDHSGAIGSLAGIAGGLIGQKQQGDAINSVVSRTLPYSSSSPFGTVNVGNGTIDINPADNPFAGMLQQLSQAGIANYGATTNDPLSALPPELRAQLTTSLAQNGGAASKAFAALGNFDPEAAAAAYTTKLDARAAPEEALARQKLEDRLFAQGRLGTSGGGITTRALYQAQGDADLAREIAGYQYAGDEQSRLAQTASNFGTAATNTALTGHNAAEAARSRMLDTALGANQTYQSLFNPLLQQAQLGIGAGAGQVPNVTPLIDQAKATTDLYSGAFAQLLPAATSWLQSRYGSDSLGYVTPTAQYVGR